MYPNGVDRLVTSSKPVYKAKGYELHDNGISNRPTTYDTESESRANNLYASRNKVFDIAYMNSFQLFVTLTLDKEKIDRYGVWLALIAWVPIIGDIVAIALGFYKTRPGWTMVLLLVGKFARFLVWNLVVVGIERFL